MKSVKVSVVVPAYNQATYLGEALASALAQTHSDLEVIVVDDGSTDDTRKICESFGDSRVRYIYQTNDRTMGIGARNHAILEARGDWIGLLDQDDRWLPDKLEKQLRRANEQADAAAVFCRVRFIDGVGHPTGEQQGPLPEGDVFHALLGGNQYYAVSGLFRRTLLPVIGLPHAWVGLADHLLWLTIARHATVAVVGDLLAEYRVHEQGYQAIQRSAGLMRLADDRWQLSAAQAVLLHRDCATCKKSHIRARRGAAQLYLRALEAQWEAGSFASSSVVIWRVINADMRRPGVLLRGAVVLARSAFRGMTKPTS